MQGCCNARVLSIRPTMRPHDDKMIVWWWNYIRHHYLRSKSSIFQFLTKAWPADRPTEGRTDGPGYRDARTHLKMLSFQRRERRATGQRPQRPGASSYRDVLAPGIFLFLPYHVLKNEKKTQFLTWQICREKLEDSYWRNELSFFRWGKFESCHFWPRMGRLR